MTTVLMGTSNNLVILAKAGIHFDFSSIQSKEEWIPAFAGMTTSEVFRGSLLRQRPHDPLGIVVDGAQQRFRRPGGFTATLLPIAQRAELYVDHLGKLGLRQPGRRTDLLDFTASTWNSREGTRSPRVISPICSMLSASFAKRFLSIMSTCS